MSIEQAVNTARTGHQVAIVGRQAAHHFAQAETLAPDAARIQRANGQQRITFPSGGTVQFHRGTTALRGQTLDVAYLTDGLTDAPQYAEALAPCFATTGPARIGVLI